MKIRLESIRDCLEGVIPGTIATAGSDGMPNIAYLSQVQYVTANTSRCPTSSSTPPAATSSPTPSPA